jgi:hypothetical protein
LYLDFVEAASKNTALVLLEELEKARLEGDIIKANDIQQQIMRLLGDKEKLYS